MLHRCLQAFTGGPLVQARNIAVMTGVNAGISCVMKRLRGKEDVQSRYVFMKKIVNYDHTGGFGYLQLLLEGSNL